MNSRPLIIQWENSELTAVPALHFNHVFALQVRRILTDPRSQIEAVAVELGPRTAIETVRWLKELGVAPGVRKELPVMLGMITRNRMIRASLREKAIRLQRELRQDLSEMDPEILHRELGYSGYGAVYLSPVDSIIEALRSAVELDLPCYGVDLEEMSDCRREPALVQDPIGTARDFPAYIALNAPFAAAQRDEEVDGRREIAMAARLKGLLKERRRILFTGGLAHWLKIKQFMRDPKLRPSPVTSLLDTTVTSYKRVLVHPSLAVGHMDLFPQLVAEYEKRRWAFSEAPDAPPGPVDLDPHRTFRQCLQKACEEYFAGSPSDAATGRRQQDLEKLRDFEDYLASHCLLSMRSVPHLFMALRVARQLVSKEFAETLSRVFMDFPWASADDYPQYPLLAPSAKPVDAGLVALWEDGRGGGKLFHIRTIPSGSGRLSGEEVLFHWPGEREKGGIRVSRYLHYTWLPWDYLAASLCLRAIRAVLQKAARRTIEVFSGSLLDGLDIKSTIRAYAKGDDRFYVRDSRKGPVGLVEPTRGFPVVWLLSDQGDGPGRWVCLNEPFAAMAKYVRNQGQLQRLEQERGSCLIAVIGYAAGRARDSLEAGGQTVQCEHFKGMVFFQPSFLSNRQFARWAELTGYKRNPICRDHSLGEGYPSDLDEYYAHQGIRLSEHHWSTSLILLGLPFADGVLTVVAPKDYQFGPAVLDQARDLGVSVVKAPLERFSEQELERLSRCHLAPILESDPENVYHPDIEKAIGEPQTAYRHLVPPHWLDFGKDPEWWEER